MKSWLIALSLTISVNLSAQDIPRKAFNPARLVDEIFTTQDLDISYQDLYENYLQLISNPLDLNTVTQEQLRSLYVLKEDQIIAFLKYRQEAGPFISVYELQTIFDGETFHQIVPFVVVPDATQSFNKNIFNRIATEPNNYLLVRWARTAETQKGYTEKASSSRYLGTPDNFYSRYRTSRAGDFSLGYTLKKDAGEKIDWNPSRKYYGFDYLSFHFQTMNKGAVKNLIIGDYQAQFGQGIALGSFFGIGKNAEAVTTMRRANLGFLPYTSIYEAGYFRGAAVSYAISKNITLHSMLSHRGRDGSLHQDTTAARADYLSAFGYTGLHRTASELANRNAITETNLAGVLQFNNHVIDAGLIFHQTQFSVPLLRNPSVYNQFAFNGNANTNAGAFLNYSVNNFSFFSEVTQTIGRGRGIVAGVLGSMTPQLEVSMVYRKFDKNFYSFYSNAIAENSIPQNESGIYWGWKYTFNKKYSIAGYFDLFSFPWLKYRSYAPSDGSEWLVRFNYRPSKTVYIFLQARQESKQRNTGSDANLYLTANGVKQNYWINCDYSAGPRLSFRTRAQFSCYSISGKTTYGNVFLQSISYELGRFTFTGCHALFDTDDYDNRLYVYERDAWLAFSFPAYYGKGIREYVLLQYRVNKQVDVWLRWARTLYNNNTIIGSNGDAITGDTRNDIKFQARIRF